MTGGLRAGWSGFFGPIGSSGPGRIVSSRSFQKWEESLLAPGERATLHVTWSYAPERVRAARARSFLDLGNGELLFVGGWRPGSSPLTGFGWQVSRDWVVEYVLRGSVIPALLAEDPAQVRRRLAAPVRRREPRSQAVNSPPQSQGRRCRRRRRVS